LRDMMALRDYVDEGPMGKRRLPVLAAEDEDQEEEGDGAEDADEDSAPVETSTDTPGDDFDVVDVD